jgi:hypothetical protein
MGCIWYVHEWYIDDVFDVYTSNLQIIYLVGLAIAHFLNVIIVRWTVVPLKGCEGACINMKISNTIIIKCVW